MEIPVHVIDDAEDVRQSVAMLLESAGIPCHTYASALELLAVVKPGWIGCVVADVMMPVMNGIELTKELRLRDVQMPVILITAHADVPMAVTALKAGAVDFIEKPYRDDVLLASLNVVRASIEPSPRGNAAPASGQGRLALLSPREREVMLLLVAGHTNKIVADRLGISVRTVEVHRANLMAKSGAKSLSELVRIACLVDHTTSDNSGSEQA
jgi:two-component system response regulator FixJ